MHRNQNARHFYKSGQLCTVVTQSSSWSAVCSDAECLGERLAYTASPSVALVLGTNMSGSVIISQTLDIRAHLNYTPYGSLRQPCFASGCLRFNSERLFDGTNDYLLGGYRLFSPQRMRFYSPDTDSPFGDGGINTYAYCAGDPINYRDPSGHGKIGLGAVSNRRTRGRSPEIKEILNDPKFLGKEARSVFNTQRAAINTDDIKLFTEDKHFVEAAGEINTMKRLLREAKKNPKTATDSYTDLLASAIYGKADRAGIPTLYALGIRASTRYARYLQSMSEVFRITFRGTLEASIVSHMDHLPPP